VRRDPLGLVRGLLATTVWVPDLAAALRVAAALPQGWQAVTREGELVRADGVVRLGSPAAPLARQGELARLAAELAATTGQATEAGDRLREARARCDAAGAAAAEAAAALESARQERRILEGDLRRAASASELAAREAAWAGAQASRLSGSLDRARAALAVVEGAEPAERGDQGAPAVGEADALGRWQARLESLEARRAALVAEDERLAAVAAAAADRQRRAELAIVAEEERLADIERRTRELESALAELERERATAATDLASARHAEADAAAALAELDAGELADRSRLAEAERTAATSRERLRGAEEAVRTAELAALQARVGLDAVREQVLVELAGLGELGLATLLQAADETTASSQAPAAAEAAWEGADEEAREAAAALQLEATLDVVLRGWADAEPTASAPAEAPSAGRLAALRRRYHEVGASNPFAAQEYAEVRARLEDLEAQQEDLDRAIAATRALIGELNERITRQFRDTFAALETAFARRFEQLFGGGEAQLVLTEPEDLAATGVEIMARPPGKKRQALAMLSGGECALTAVALLFSMLDVRPVPFCVLDEVDAALDEANITRFTEALRDLAVATQFVVITHNRGTIEAADALYGITIGDDAVSRVISLRLAEATQLAEVG